MTTLWTCDVDENEVEERCEEDATHIVTWFHESDAEQNRAGHTLKVCERHRVEVRVGVQETQAPSRGLFGPTRPVTATLAGLCVEPLP